MQYIPCRPYANSLNEKAVFMQIFPKSQIPSLYNSYSIIRLNTNWIYEKAACMQKNLQAKFGFGPLIYKFHSIICHESFVLVTGLRFAP